MQNLNAKPSDSVLPAHLGGHCGITNMDVPLLEWLVKRFGVKSMLDVGCGTAGMVAAAENRGLIAWGIDGDDTVLTESPNVWTWDFCDGPFMVPDVAKFDLAWCVELVEHVEERFIANVLLTLRVAKTVLLTHAVFGQAGYHHVNCRPQAYWVCLMDLAGFSLIERETREARVLATNVYTQSTAMVFQRR